MPLGIYFDRANLAGVHVPVREFAAGADSVLRLPGNAGRVRADLPQPPEYTVIPQGRRLHGVRSGYAGHATRIACR